MIIVTGASGFIGSNLVARLLENASYCRGEEILLCDWVKPQTRPSLVGCKTLGALDFVTPDQLPVYLDTNASEVSAIYHLGAISDTRAQDGADLQANNVDFSLWLWHYAQKQQAAFIYASSASTYGDGALGYDDLQGIAYHQSLKPMNAYGRSKQAVDIQILTDANAGNAPRTWAGLKFFNVYGSGELHKGAQRSVAHQMLEKLPHSNRLSLFQSHRPDVAHGEQKRDFVWVGDAVNAMVGLASGHCANGIYNCGSGKAHSFQYLAECCFAVNDLPAQIDYTPMPMDIREHYQYFTQANMQRLQDQPIGYTPTPLSVGVGLLKEYFNQTQSQEHRC